MGAFRSSVDTQRFLSTAVTNGWKLLDRASISEVTSFGRQSMRSGCLSGTSKGRRLHLKRSEAEPGVGGTKFATGSAALILRSGLASCWMSFLPLRS